MSQHQHSDGPCPDGEACPDARRYGSLHPAPSQPADAMTAARDWAEEQFDFLKEGQPAEGPTPETEGVMQRRPALWRKWTDADFCVLEHHARSLERRMNKARRDLASVKKIAEGLVSKNERYAAKSDLQARNFAKCQEELAVANNAYAAVEQVNLQLQAELAAARATSAEPKA